MTRRAIAFLAISTTLLGGCASSGVEYPSLAIRDVERVQGQFEPVEDTALHVPKVDVDLTGGLPARLTALVAQAEDAHRTFQSATPRASGLADAASGSTVGSDNWAAAQVALAELDSARSHAAVALGDLDALYVAASVEASERDSIVTARDRVIAVIREEDAILERLRARIR